MTIIQVIKPKLGELPIRIAYSPNLINIDHVILAKARIQREYDYTPLMGLSDE